MSDRSEKVIQYGYGVKNEQNSTGLQKSIELEKMKKALYRSDAADDATIGLLIGTLLLQSV